MHITACKRALNILQSTMQNTLRILTCNISICVTPTAYKSNFRHFKNQTVIKKKLTVNSRTIEHVEMWNKLVRIPYPPITACRTPFGSDTVHL